MSEAGFLNAIRADPTDAATRLIYADYLEEHGDVRAEFLRLNARLAEPALEYTEFDALRERAKQVRASLFPKHQKWLAAVDAPDRFTILLTNEHCDARRSLGKVGRPFDFVAVPKWNRFKPATRPLIYGLRIQLRQLYVVGRLRLAAVLYRGAYLRRRPDDEPLLSPFQNTAILVGDHCTLFLPDTRVSAEMLSRFHYRSGEHEYPLKHVKYGELTHPVHLTGVTRITKTTAQDLDFLLAGQRTMRCP